jgi:transposase
MIIIGCDFHSRFQYITWMDKADGVIQQLRLEHPQGADQFYRGMQGHAVTIGMEAGGQSRWFERLLAELGFELWVGNPAAIRASVVRKQKTDKRDSAHNLELMLDDKFPRVWVPPAGEREVRQLVMHRYRLIQARTRFKNQLQALARNEALPARPGLWTQKGRERFEAVELPKWMAQRRKDGLELLDELNRRIDPLDEAVQQQAESRPEVVRLMTHPGVGPVTALAFVATLGDPHRFPCGKKVASYLGLIPSEYSSGDRQRLGHISKQGNAVVRGLLVGSAVVVDVGSRTGLRSNGAVRFACRETPG